MIRLLGPLSMNDRSRFSRLAAKPSTALALLLLRSNEVVPLSVIIDEIWFDVPPPPSAVNTVQTYVYQIRKLLNSLEAPPVLIATAANGYCLRIDPAEVDVHIFDRLLQKGCEQLRRGEAELASKTLRAALELWRGPALADIRTGSVLLWLRQSLKDLRLQAVENRIEADFVLGRHRELVGELKEICSAYPHSEAFYGQLMLALYRSGRRDDALHCYRQLRDALVNELGIEPAPNCQRLHQAILACDHGIELKKGREHLPPQALTTPRQLPPDISDFVGFDEELAAAEQTFGQRADPQ